MDPSRRRIERRFDPGPPEQLSLALEARLRPRLLIFSWFVAFSFQLQKLTAALGVTACGQSASLFAQLVNNCEDQGQYADKKE